jgi:hypothetical protein
MGKQLQVDKINRTKAELIQLPEGTKLYTVPLSMIEVVK